MSADGHKMDAQGPWSNTVWADLFSTAFLNLLWENNVTGKDPAFGLDGREGREEEEHLAKVQFMDEIKVLQAAGVGVGCWESSLGPHDARLGSHH